MWVTTMTALLRASDGFGCRQLRYDNGILEVRLPVQTGATTRGKQIAVLS